MLIRTMCNTCFQTFELLVEPHDTHLLKDICDQETMQAPCPRLCGGRVLLESSNALREMVDDRRLREPLTISMREFYQAVYGAGLPDEIPKSVEAVAAILKTNPIVDIEAEEKWNRIVIRKLKLKGMTVHLAAGVHGAIVSKITKEGSDV